MSSDPLDVVRELAPAIDEDHDLLDRVRMNLMSTITASEPATESLPSRRRRWAVPIAAVAVLATAAAGWAVVRRPPAETVVMCPDNDILNAVTGDPVVDCTTNWSRSNAGEPPAMVAYDNGNGGIAVLVAGDTVPDGYVALEAGAVQNTTLIELEAALGDVGRGFPSGCFDAATAGDIARRELDRLGLDDWSVTVDASRVPDGATNCAYFLVYPDALQVELFGFGSGGPRGQLPFVAFAIDLETQLAATCMGLADAGDLTRTLAANAEVVIDGNHIDLSEEGGALVIYSVVDSSAACTRSNVVVGGAVAVTLRGPAS